MDMGKVGFEDIIKDKTTNIKGMVVCKAYWKNGCNKVLIQPTAGKDKKLPDTLWVDIQDVVIISKGKPPKKQDVGGPVRVSSNFR